MIPASTDGPNRDTRAHPQAKEGGRTLGEDRTGGEGAPGHLLGAADIRRIASEAAVSPSKKFGQNFVIDPGTVRRIARQAQVGPGSQVLEVGPGLGSLTLALLENGARVWAVEIDPALAARLPGTVQAFMPEATDRLTVLNQDALTLSPVQTAGGLGWEDPDGDLVLVANLPYHVATPILLTLLERFPGLDRFTVMVQKEVADRLVARPGSKIYGTPSLKLAWYGRSERVGLVGRHVFWPAPNVDSALVGFHRYSGLPGDRPSWMSDPLPVVPTGPMTTGHGSAGRETLGRDQGSLRQLTFALIDAAFGQRRKTLHAALKSQVPAAVFRRAGIDPGRRGETLAIEEFVALARALRDDQVSVS